MGPFAFAFSKSFDRATFEGKTSAKAEAWAELKGRAHMPESASAVCEPANKSIRADFTIVKVFPKGAFSSIAIFPVVKVEKERLLLPEKQRGQAGFL
jgi:hypothetical protein